MTTNYSAWPEQFMEPNEECIERRYQSDTLPKKKKKNQGHMKLDKNRWDGHFYYNRIC
jgi:hypothetical protein